MYNVSSLSCPQGHQAKGHPLLIHQLHPAFASPERQKTQENAFHSSAAALLHYPFRVCFVGQSKRGREREVGYCSENKSCSQTQTNSKKHFPPPLPNKRLLNHCGNDYRNVLISFFFSKLPESTAQCLFYLISHSHY